MFPYYKGPQESRDLGYDDIMAMYELYSRLSSILIIWLSKLIISSFYSPQVKNGVYSDDDDLATKSEADIDFASEEVTTKKATINPTSTNTEITHSTTENVEVTTESILWSVQKTDSTAAPSIGSTIGSDCNSSYENKVEWKYVELPKKQMYKFISLASI